MKIGQPLLMAGVRGRGGEIRVQKTPGHPHPGLHRSGKQFLQQCKKPTGFRFPGGREIFPDFFHENGKFRLSGICCFFHTVHPPEHSWYVQGIHLLSVEMVREDGGEDRSEKRNAHISVNIAFLRAKHPTVQQADNTVLNIFFNRNLRRPESMTSGRRASGMPGLKAAYVVTRLLCRVNSVGPSHYTAESVSASDSAGPGSPGRTRSKAATHAGSHLFPAPSLSMARALAGDFPF